MDPSRWGPWGTRSATVVASPIDHLKEFQPEDDPSSSKPIFWSQGYNTTSHYKMDESNSTVLDENFIFDSIPVKHKKNAKQNCYPYSWNPRIANKIWMKLKYSTLPENIPIITLNEEKGYENFDLEILRLKYLLMFYADHSTGEEAFSWYDILKRTILEGPSFALELSKCRKYSYICTFSHLPPDFIEEDCVVLKDRIDEIYDPQCLIRWALPIELEFKESLVERDADPYYLYLLEEELEDLIPEGIDCQLDILDELNYFKSTNVYLDFLDPKTKKDNRTAHLNKDANYTNQIRGVLTPVWKNPEELREAVTLDLDSLHTLCDASKKMGLIFKDIPGYCVNSAMQKASQLYKMRNYKYLMMDYSKNGWTMSRKLVLLGLKVLVRKYPNEEVFKKTLEGYTLNPIIRYEDFDYVIKSGTMLGMLIELVTVLSIASFNVLRDHLHLIPEDFKGWFNNDDTLLFCRKQIYEENEYDINLPAICESLEGFGWKVHQKKPFLSDVGEWAKVWSLTKFNQENQTRQFSNLISPLDCVNITHAKEMYSNLHKKFWGLDDRDHQMAMQCLLHYWGYEFHPEEQLLPFEYGGWVKESQHGLNPALTKFQEYAPKWRRVFLTHTPVIKFKEKERKGIEYIRNKLYSMANMEDLDPSLSVFMDWKQEVDSLLESVNQNIFWQTKYKSRSALKEWRNRSYWERFYKKRQEQYKKKETITYGESLIRFQKFVLSKKWNNYSPPDIVISKGKVPPLVPWFDVPKCNDIHRFLGRELYEMDLRKTKNLPGSLLHCIGLNQFNINKLSHDPWSWSKFYAEIGTLSFFGDPLKIHMDLYSRFGFDYHLINDDQKYIPSLKKLAVGKEGDYLCSIDGILCKIDIDKMDILSKVDHIYKCDQVLELINPDLDYQLWREWVNKVHQFYLGQDHFLEEDLDGTFIKPIVDVKAYFPKFLIEDMEDKQLEDQKRDLEAWRYEAPLQMASDILPDDRTAMWGNPEQRQEYFEQYQGELYQIEADGLDLDDDEGIGMFGDSSEEESD